MSDGHPTAKDMVAKMRTNTAEQPCRTSVKLWRKSRKKVQKNRLKKS